MKSEERGRMSSLQRKDRSKVICCPQVPSPRNPPTFLHVKQGQPHNTLIKITPADL